MNPRLRKFLSYYSPYRWLFLADLACAVAAAVIALLLPLLAREITKSLETITSHTLNQIYSIGLAMLALAALHMACQTFVDYQGHMMGAKMESDMRAELFDHYQKLSFRFYDDQRTGQLMSRLTNDLFSLSEFYHHVPEDFIIALLKFTGVFVVLLTINVQLTTIIFVILPLMAVYAFYFNRRLNAIMLTTRARIGDVNAQVEDTLAGVRTVQSFTNEAIERQKFAHHNAQFVSSRRAEYRGEAYFYGGMSFFTQLMTIGVVILGSVGIVHGTLDLPDLLTYVLYIGILIEPIQRAVNIARLYREGYTGFTRFMEILDIEPDITDMPNAIDIGQARGHVQFNDVSFKYRDEHDEVLKHISLDIRAGEYVALVGTSGVGKTTLCSLIPRFYEATTGAVLLDGVNVKDITLRSLRRNIGVVQQDVYLFAGTVAENIRYGRPDADREAILDAAKRANAHDFIMALPDGYDTDIGQRGVKLSGGQKQRLSIARVFLKNPPVLIFDEATSSLDNESEKAVRESMEALSSTRTTLVIAHRLSTIRNAHRIIVLTGSGVEEQGTHDELIARSGAYARLYHTQASL